MALQLSRAHRHVLLARHLQQINPPDQRASDWVAHAELNMSVAGPVAERVRATHLAGVEIEVAGHSQLLRAKRSAKLLVPQAKRFVEMPALSPSDFADPDGLWQVCERMKGLSAKETFEFAPELMRSEGKKIGDHIKSEALMLRDGEAALLVSHGPIVDAAFAYLTDVWAGFVEFGKGDIVHLEFELMDKGSISTVHAALVTSQVLRIPPSVDKLA